jgi:hypothetical protein
LNFERSIGSPCRSLIARAVHMCDLPSHHFYLYRQNFLSHSYLRVATTTSTLCHIVMDRMVRHAHGGPPGTRARRSRAPAERRRSAGARPWLPHISMAEARRRRTSRAHRALARRWRRTHPKATVLHGAPAARRAAARWAAHLLAFHISHRPLTSQPLCRKKVLWSTSGLIR